MRTVARTIYVQLHVQYMYTLNKILNKDYKKRYITTMSTNYNRRHLFF